MEKQMSQLEFINRANGAFYQHFMNELDDFIDQIVDEYEGSVTEQVNYRSLLERYTETMDVKFCKVTQPTHTLETFLK